MTTYDRNSLHTRTPANDSSYRFVFIAREWGPGHPPQAVSDRLKAQLAAGRITWRFAVVCQARMTRLYRLAQVTP